MGNYDFKVRSKRWIKFLANSIYERIRGLDFSMVYVGELQRNVEEFHGYSMTDSGDMKRVLQRIPAIPQKSAFLDVGCGKGMCLKCAVEAGYKSVAGLDLDRHLLEIARKNMDRLNMKVDCIYANATDFARYADYDVFYFYNPFGKTIFQQVIGKLIDSQTERNREIWVAYYHPVYGDLFEQAGFTLEQEIRDKTRDTTTRIFYLPPRRDGEFRA